MTANQPRNFSVLTTDLERNPGLLERIKARAGHNATVTTIDDTTTITAA